MRNLWYCGMMACLYLFFSWAVEEAFAEPLGGAGGKAVIEKKAVAPKKASLFKILLPPAPRVRREAGEKERGAGEAEKGATTLLETISLSYGGNYYVSETIKQGRELAGALVSALGSLVDLRLVRSLVDGVIERLHVDREGRSDLGRSDRDRSDLDLEADTPDPAREEIKEKITTFVGAALGEQECWQRSACLAGEYAANLPGKDVIFIVLDRLAPASWTHTLSTIKQSATYVQDCSRFVCSTDPGDKA